MPAADSWCNGAGGIALARLRAHALLGTPALRRDADVALAACERHVAGLLGRDPHDFSLCHGATGAGDVLLAGGRAELAAQVGRLGIERHGRPGAPDFPCGVPGGRRRRSCRASRGSACSTSGWPIAAWRARCSSA